MLAPDLRKARPGGTAKPHANQANLSLDAWLARTEGHCKRQTTRLFLQGFEIKGGRTRLLGDTPSGMAGPLATQAQALRGVRPREVDVTSFLRGMSQAVHAWEISNHFLPTSTARMFSEPED